MEIILLTILGSITGFFSGLLGIGGGLLFVPGMLFILQDVPKQEVMHFALGASLIATVFNASINTITHQRKKKIIWEYVYKLLPTVIIGTIIGVIVVSFLTFDVLKNTFAVYEIIVAFIMFFGLTASSHLHSVKTWVWRVVGFITGFLSSLFGINGGTMTNPFLIYNNLKVGNAMAVATAVGLPISIVGSIGFMIVNDGILDIIKLTAIIAPAFVFAPFGVWVLHRSNGEVIKKIFAIFVGLIGISVLLN